MIELMVVIFILGLMATMVIPRFINREPAAEWPNILDDLNSLILFARQEAISYQRVYRLTFTATPPTRQDSVVVEEELENPEKPGAKIYKPVTSYVNTKYIMPASVKIRAIYIGKEKVISEGEPGSAHCYIIPDGLVQDSLVLLSRKNEMGEMGGSFKIMPFFGRFEFFEGYTKPER